MSLRDSVKRAADGATLAVFLGMGFPLLLITRISRATGLIYLTRRRANPFPPDSRNFGSRDRRILVLPDMHRNPTEFLQLEILSPIARNIPIQL